MGRQVNEPACPILLYIREANHTSHPEGVKPAHKEYIYDLGEHRFRDSYHTTRPEYNDHAFNAKIDGKTRKIRIPAKIVREIHLQCESEAHPITFHQKLQPNYVDGQTHGPNKAGKMTVQNVGYYNSIQSSMMMPNYFRQKAWAIQNEIFDNGLKYRQVIVVAVVVCAVVYFMRVCIHYTRNAQLSRSHLKLK